MIYEISCKGKHACDTLSMSDENRKLLIPTYQITALACEKKCGILYIYISLNFRSYRLNILQNLKWI